MTLDKKEFEKKAKEIISKRVEDVENFKLDVANIKMYEEDGQEHIKVSLLFVKPEQK